VSASCEWGDIVVDKTFANIDYYFSLVALKKQNLIISWAENTTNLKQYGAVLLQNSIRRHRHQEYARG